METNRKCLRTIEVKLEFKSNNDLSNSFIVSKAQREEGTHSKSQDKTPEKKVKLSVLG